jgi:O-antigen biosynthesis protein
MSLSFNPLEYPILFAAPRRVTRNSAWHGHIPFAMLLVELLKPEVIVELGTYYGDSYCAFCQAVEQLGLTTRCYAIDSWRGYQTTGLYGPKVLEDLRAHHDRLYSGFSQLIRSSFDETEAQFGGGAIDLLHIDGRHRYEAVRHDFECWQPRLSRRAVVLFHDICMRGDGFGAWKFWDELKDRYPFLEFLHSSGLGVLAVGPDQPERLRELMEASAVDLARLRYLFFRLGHLSSFTEKEDGIAEKESGTNLRQIASLEQTVAEQAVHLNALTPQFALVVNRVAEQKRLLLDAHRQLLARDHELERLRESEARQQEHIHRMMATRVWKLGKIYWRALALLRPAPRS